MIYFFYNLRNLFLVYVCHDVVANLNGVTKAMGITYDVQVSYVSINAAGQRIFSYLNISLTFVNKY